jgi:hypothetical protein
MPPCCPVSLPLNWGSLTARIDSSSCIVRHSGMGSGTDEEVSGSLAVACLRQGPMGCARPPVLIIKLH